MLGRPDSGLICVHCTHATVRTDAYRICAMSGFSKSKKIPQSFTQSGLHYILPVFVNYAKSFNKIWNNAQLRIKLCYNLQRSTIYQQRVVKCDIVLKNMKWANNERHNDVYNQAVVHMLVCLVKTPVWEWKSSYNKVVWCKMVDGRIKGSPGGNGSNVFHPWHHLTPKGIAMVISVRRQHQFYTFHSAYSG